MMQALNVSDNIYDCFNLYKRKKKSGLFSMNADSFREVIYDSLYKSIQKRKKDTKKENKVMNISQVKLPTIDNDKTNAIIQRANSVLNMVYLHYYNHSNSAEFDNEYRNIIRKEKIKINPHKIIESLRTLCMPKDMYGIKLFEYISQVSNKKILSKNQTTQTTPKIVLHPGVKVSFKQFVLTKIVNNVITHCIEIRNKTNQVISVNQVKDFFTLELENLRSNLEEKESNEKSPRYNNNNSFNDSLPKGNIMLNKIQRMNIHSMKKSNEISSIDELNEKSSIDSTKVLVNNIINNSMIEGEKELKRNNSQSYFGHFQNKFTLDELRSTTNKSSEHSKDGVKYELLHQILNQFDKVKINEHQKIEEDKQIMKRLKIEDREKRKLYKKKSSIRITRNPEEVIQEEKTNLNNNIKDTYTYKETFSYNVNNEHTESRKDTNQKEALRLTEKEPSTSVPKRRNEKQFVLFSKNSNNDNISSEDSNEQEIIRSKHFTPKIFSPKQNESVMNKPPVQILPQKVIKNVQPKPHFLKKELSTVPKESDEHHTHTNKGSVETKDNQEQTSEMLLSNTSNNNTSNPTNSAMKKTKESIQLKKNMDYFIKKKKDDDESREKATQEKEKKTNEEDKKEEKEFDKREYYRKKMDSSKLSKKDNKKQKQNNKENYPSSPRNQKGNNAITQYGKDIPIKNAQTVMIQNGIEVSTKETNQILSRDDGDSNSKKVTLLEKIKPKDKRFSVQTLAKSNRLGSLVKSAMTQNEKSKFNTINSDERVNKGTIPQENTTEQKQEEASNEPNVQIIKQPPIIKKLPIAQIKNNPYDIFGIKSSDNFYMKRSHHQNVYQSTFSKKEMKLEQVEINNIYHQMHMTPRSPFKVLKKFQKFRRSVISKNIPNSTSDSRINSIISNWSNSIFDSLNSSKRESSRKEDSSIFHIHDEKSQRNNSQISTKRKKKFAKMQNSRMRTNLFRKEFFDVNKEKMTESIKKKEEEQKKLQLEAEKAKSKRYEDFVRTIRNLREENPNEYIKKLTEFFDDQMYKSELLMKKNLEDRINAFKNSVYKNASLRQDYNKFMGGRLVFKNICEMKYKQNEYKNGVF